MRPSRPAPAFRTLAVCLGAALAAVPAGRATAAMGVSQPPGYQAVDYARFLTGCGVVVTDARFVGAGAALALFTGGTEYVGTGAGVVLSTGSAAGVARPNQASNSGTAHGTAGDPDLSALVGAATFDAASLEFEFIPSGTTVTFEYAFASEEYNEYANTRYNDVFAFFLNGANVATVPGSTVYVTINNVNGGNPYGINPQNAAYFLCNAADGCSAFAGSGFSATRFAGFELDGLTVIFTVTATVAANHINRMKIAIADVGDAVYDSAVFIRARSLGSACSPPPAPVSAAGAPVPGVRPVPNPWRPGSGGWFDAPTLDLLVEPPGAGVRIYALDGRLVVELDDADGDGRIPWDGRGRDGRAVAPGVYQVLMRHEPTGVTRTSRIVVVR
jgi:hypothetical protein